MGVVEVEAVAEEEEEAVGGTIGGGRGEADPDETSPADFETKKVERRCCRPENSSRFLAAKGGGGGGSSSLDRPGFIKSQSRTFPFPSISISSWKST